MYTKLDTQALSHGTQSLPAEPCPACCWTWQIPWKLSAFCSLRGRSASLCCSINKHYQQNLAQASLFPSRTSLPVPASGVALAHRELGWDWSRLQLARLDWAGAELSLFKRMTCFYILFSKHPLPAESCTNFNSPFLKQHTFSNQFTIF